MRMKISKVIAIVATCLLLMQMLIFSAEAATITIASTTIAPSTTYPTSPSATATLRIYSSITFTASDGTVVMAGTPGSGAFFKSVTCTISGGVITIPSFTLLSTTDAADNSNARYTAIFFDVKGVKRDTYLADFPLPVSLGSPVTWGQLRVYKSGTQPWRDTSVYTKTQTDAQIQAAIGSGNDASDTVKGRTKLSVAPVSSSNPIAVGDPDPRVTANQPANVASIRSLGTGALQAAAGNDSRLSDSRAPLVNSPVTVTLPYAGDGSTIVGKIVKLVAGNAVTTTVTDAGGAVGIVSAGTTNSVTVVIAGRAGCTPNGSVSAGDYIQIDTGFSGGYCRGVGNTYPTSGQVIGRVLVGDGGSGTAIVDVFGSEVRAGLNGIAFSGTPSAGQVPTATSSTTATWQTFSGGPCGAQLPGVVVVTCAPYNADSTGATSSYAAFLAALSSGAVYVMVPPGAYNFTQSDITAHQTLIDMSPLGNGGRLIGAGRDRSFITVPATVAWNASDTTVALMNAGDGQELSGFTFVGAPTVTSGNVAVISVEQTSTHGHVHDVKIRGWNNASGGGSAGAACITTHRLSDVNEINTTLGTTIVAGSQTVTPVSMSGIYAGRTLSIGGTSESVLVTAVTATTFTATFLNAHSSGDSVTATSDGYQSTLIEDFEILDNPRASALIINSNGNTIQHGTVRRIGLTSNQHSLYVQGGHNYFNDLWLEGIAGYGIHQYPNGGGITNSSGNVYHKVTVLNARTLHLLISGEYSLNGYEDTANGSSPLYPSGTGLDRYTVITDSVFRNTGGYAQGGIDLRGPVLFDNNVLEDIPGPNYRRNPLTHVTCNNISRAIFLTSVYDLQCSVGAGMRLDQGDAPSLVVGGINTSPYSTGSLAGGDLVLTGGMGVRVFTVVSNTAGSVTLTVDGATMVSGTDFALGSDNSAGQKNVTANNILQAMYDKNLTNRVSAWSVGPNVYVARLAHVSNQITDFTTNNSGRISVSVGENGHSKIANGLQWITGPKPTCDATQRGRVWYVAGGAGVADTFEVCKKDAADSYAWTTLF